MNQPATTSKIQSVRTRFIDYIWTRDLTAESWWKALYIHVLRILYVVIRDLGDGEMTLRAMSLVYTTLMSLVPVLAISFSVLKGFGVQNQIEPMLLNFVAPLGAQGAEIVTTTIEFVERMKVGVLGSVGVALLIYTVIAVMQKVERAFNHIWHISRPRAFARRFSDYLSVALVGPLLIFASIGISGTLKAAPLLSDVLSLAPIGTALQAIGIIVPWLLSIAAFAFIYTFIPNTKVELSSALVGGIAATILWKLVGAAFAAFIATSGKYEAVYAAFSSLIFFMVWLYLTWLILMIGAAVAFYHQHPEYLTMRYEARDLSNRVKERLALLIMQQVGQALYAAAPPRTTDEFAYAVGAPVDVVQQTVDALARAGILVGTAEDEAAYLPGRALDTLALADVLAAIRTAGEEGYLAPDKLKMSDAVTAVVDDSTQAADAALAGRTVKDLVVSTNDGIPAAGPASTAEAGE